MSWFGDRLVGVGRVVRRRGREHHLAAAIWQPAEEEWMYAGHDPSERVYVTAFGGWMTRQDLIRGLPSGMCPE